MIDKCAPAGPLRPGKGSAAQTPRLARTRFESIYQTIRERIALLDYAPNQRLAEEVLANEFGTSRTPIRRVLGKLEDEGLIQSVQSVGTIVTDIDFDTLSQTYRLRMELAELIGKLDPVRPHSTVITSLHNIQKRIRAMVDDAEPREFAKANIEFFYAIMAMTENIPLREISERLYFRTTRIWIHSIDQLGFAQEKQVFLREVADIVAAVEIGDLAAVGHIRRSHISMSFQRLRAKITSCNVSDEH